MEDSLPKDVMLDIVSRLPVKTIIYFRCVCKKWRDVVSDPDFVRFYNSKSRNALIILHGQVLPAPPTSANKLVGILLSLCSNDEQVLKDACLRALSYMSHGTNDKIQAVIEVGVCKRLVELLLHPSPSVVILALQIVGNIVTGDNHQTRVLYNNICKRLVELLLHPSPSVVILALQIVGNIVTGDNHQTRCIIEHGVLPCLFRLLTNNRKIKKSIAKKACWTISKITAGNKEQIQSVMGASLIGPLVSLLQTKFFDLTKEAACALSNATSGGTIEQIKFMVSQGLIKPLCNLLVCEDPRIVTVSLEGLENILKAGEVEKKMGNNGESYLNHYAKLINDAKGLQKIQNLLCHCDEEVKEKAKKILATNFFALE